MKADKTQSLHHDEPASQFRLHWTWELEAIGALLVLVWLLGLIQFLDHMG